MTTAVDTSVVVAALSPWHERHEVARSAIEDHGPRLPAHVLVESLAVLTRLPDRAVAPDLAFEALRRTFPEEPLALPSSALRKGLARAVGADVAGGRLYDLVVGVTAAHHRAPLLTGDRRARSTYELARCDVLAVW